MPSPDATRQAEELLPCHPTCGLQDPAVSRHHDDCPRRFRPAVAFALEEADERGRKDATTAQRDREERLLRVLERITAERDAELERAEAARAEVARMREREGEQVAAALSSEARLRERVRWAAETSEAVVERSGSTEHRHTARVLRGILEEEE